jgi:threonine aldolase
MTTGETTAAPIDLRSDTVTRPDDEMRQAMANAVVGDDLYGEDPTARELEEEAAAALGQAAAVFVPSGLMGNQIALHLHASPGSEVICDRRGHIVQFEMGAMAALSGLLPRTLDSPRGLLDPQAVEAVIQPNLSYRSRTGLLVIENTHNLAGGTVYNRPHVDALLAVARRHSLPVHLDGARIWNAATALGTTPAVLAAGFDSVMVCLSKGLGAPVGSLLCGSRELIDEARRLRRMFGGGMRQVGVLAAAGLVALRKGPARLADDHLHAAFLAEALAELPGIEIDPQSVRTNIVVFRLTPRLWGGGPPPEDGMTAAFLARMRAAGLLASPGGHDEVRMVTHRDVGRPEIDRAIALLRKEWRPGAAAAP